MFKREFDFDVRSYLWVQNRLRSVLWSRSTAIWSLGVLVGLALVLIAGPAATAYFGLKAVGVAPAIAGIGGLSGIAVGYYLYSRTWPGLNARIGRRFARVELPEFDPVAIEVSPEGVVWRTRHAQTHVEWAGVLAIKPFPEGILLVLGLNALFFPAAALDPGESPEQLARQWEAQKRASSE